MPDKTLTEKEIRKIIQLEIKNCFEQLSSDVKDIKHALLGNDYQKGGLVSIVQSHGEYIERNKIINITERALRVVEWYEGLAEKKGTDGKSELERLEDGIQAIQTVGTIKKWMLFFGISNIGTILALVLDKILK